MYTVNHLIFPVGLKEPTRFDVVEVKLFLNSAERRTFLGHFTTEDLARDFIKNIKT